MPKVHHVKKARKSNRRYGIKKGHPYWWWKRRAPGARSGYRVVSLRPPRPSQLAGSPYLSAMLAIQEGIEDLPTSTKEECQAVAEALREAAESVREAGQEESSKKDNMPESLQEGPTGELLQSRADACETLADSLETAADEVQGHVDSWVEIEEDSNLEDEDEPESDSSDDVKSVLDGISWEFES